MKKILLMLALCGFAAPVFAQEAEPEKEKSTQELLEELHKIMKDASNEMGEAEKELAKASMPATKADVSAAKIKELREKMARGEIDEVPEGLREYIRDNASTVASLLGVSEEELKKLVDDQAKLKELLKKAPELLKRLAQSESIMESVLEHQHAAEKKLEEVLKKQKEAVETAEKKVDDAVGIAVKLRQGGC